MYRPPLAKFALLLTLVSVAACPGTSTFAPDSGRDRGAREASVDAAGLDAADGPLGDTQASEGVPADLAPKDQGPPDTPRPDLPSSVVAPYGQCQAGDAPAKFLAEQAPTTLAVGQSMIVSLTFANCSQTTWQATAVNAPTGYKLGAQAPQDNMTWGKSRVALPADVAVNQQVTIAFTIVAPAAVGNYGYRWAILHEGVAWLTNQFSPLHTVAVSGGGAVTVCPGITAANDGSASASTALQQCVDQTPSAGTLELPAGVYLMTDALRIKKPLTLRTKGTAGNAVACLLPGAPLCAQLRAAPGLNVSAGFFQIEAPASNVTVEHLVLDGNRAARLGGPAATTCAGGNNRNGFNAIARGDGHVFRYNASIHTLCGTGMEWRGNGATITNNFFDANGDNKTNMLWADGLTIHEANNSTIANNLLRDSSDVGLIVGGATNSQITGNRIEQTVQLTFAGLMLDNFNGATPGNFSGTVVSGNTVDCGNLLCDFGINLGPHAWYLSAPIFGGDVHGNTVTKAKLGLLIDGAGTATAPITVYGNTMSGSPSSAKFSCGQTRATSNYNIGPDTFVARNGDTTPTTSYAWHQCH